MIYLASPFSHSNPEIVRYRIEQTQNAIAFLLQNNIYAWSPIIQTYEVNIRHSLPTDADFWKNYNFDFMRRADAMYLLELEGWETSKGLKMEIEFCKHVGLPLYYIDPKCDYKLSTIPHLRST
jgi:hypothetical protein